jgi:RNA polymerase sigma-70 factor (ECF subfamily)
MDASGIARCIRLAREGHEDALGALLDAYRNYLRLLATTCLHRDLRAKADPSDLVQDTLLKVHRNFHQFRGATEQEWMTWLRKILVRNLADLQRGFDRQRRAVDREQPLDEAVDRSSAMLLALVPSPGPSPSEGAHTREMGALVADAMAELDDDAREVVILRSLHELEWGEIAERTERTPDAARMLWARALKRVGTLLKERTA